MDRDTIDSHTHTLSPAHTQHPFSHECHRHHAAHNVLPPIGTRTQPSISIYIMCVYIYMWYHIMTCLSSISTREKLNCCFWTLHRVGVGGTSAVTAGNSSVDTTAPTRATSTVTTARRRTTRMTTVSRPQRTGFTWNIERESQSYLWEFCNSNSYLSTLLPIVATFQDSALIRLCDFLSSRVPYASVHQTIVA